MPSATILIPTHDHGRLLTRSVRSALEQTVADIEVVIVGDGISEEGRDAADEMMRLDGRVRFLDAPKGKRHGEPTRHAILAELETDFVCYLSDDDLLLPDHVAQIRHLLGSADFAHSLPCYVQVDGEIGVWNVDLNRDVYRYLLLFGHNRIPLSPAAHTCEAYRRLPQWVAHDASGGTHQPFHVAAVPRRARNAVRQWDASHRPPFPEPRKAQLDRRSASRRTRQVESSSC